MVLYRIQCSYISVHLMEKVNKREFTYWFFFLFYLIIVSTHHRIIEWSGFEGTFKIT